MTRSRFVIVCPPPEAYPYGSLLLLRPIDPLLDQQKYLLPAILWHVFCDSDQEAVVALGVVYKRNGTVDDFVIRQIVPRAGPVDPDCLIREETDRFQEWRTDSGIIGLDVIRSKFDNSADTMIKILKKFKHFGNDRFSDMITIEIVDENGRIAID